MSSTVSEPLSLEDQCLLHLICHLEDYLPETLASLPLHLRRRLILNLPVADVWQLESTAVTAGVEDTWKNFNLKRLYNLLTELVDDYLCNPRLMKVAKEALFCAEGCLGVTNWEGIQHSFAPIGTGEGQFKYPTPYRYMRYFSEEYRQMEMISFLVENCKYSPVQFNVSSNLIEGLGESKEHILQRLLSRVQELKLDPDWLKVQENKPVYQLLFKQILVNPKTALSKLWLFGGHVNAVAKFFSPSADNDPLYSHPNIPYGGLSSIEVNRCSSNLCPQLQSVIHCQSALTSVSLSGTACTTTYSVSLVSTLGLLFHEPQFRNLSLSHIMLTWELVGVLLPPFLSAPSEDSPKALQLSIVKFRTVGTPPEHVVITTGSGVNRLPQKDLVLHPGNNIPTFLHWLSDCNYTSLLRSIEMDLFMGPGILRFPDKLTKSLQHLELRNVELIPEPSPERMFANIFQCPHLKSVSLFRCFTNGYRFLPALTQGLRRQVSVGSLEKLSLLRNQLGTSAKSQLQKFFDVVFSLPQLSNLELDLRCNLLDPHHYSLMYESWKRNAGQSGIQLKVLKVSRVINLQFDIDCEWRHVARVVADT